MNGMPMKQIARYCVVPQTASAGVPISVTMPCTLSSSMAVSTSATPANNVMVLPMASAASSSRFAPTGRPMVTVAPMASPTMTTVSM